MTNQQRHSLNRRQSEMVWFGLVNLTLSLMMPFTIGQVSGDNMVSVQAGQQTHIVCNHTSPINYCRIVVPGEKVLILSETSVPKNGFSYYGSGRNNGQCGIQIEQVQLKNNGSVICHMGMENEEIEQIVQLYVEQVPQKPKLELVPSASSQTLRSIDDTLEVGEKVTFKCVSSNGSPAPSLLWLMDDAVLSTSDISPPKVIKTPVESDMHNNLQLFTVVQQITLTVTPNDDNKTLTCRSTQSGNVQNTHVQLKVGFRPQPLEPIVAQLIASKTALINVTVHANPLPKIVWTIGKLQVKQGEQNSRFIAHEPVEITHGIYNVSLAVLNVQSEDASEYLMTATNQYGHEEYKLTMAVNADPFVEASNANLLVGNERSFDVSALLLTILGVAALLAIAFIGVARITGRCCFGNDLASNDVESAQAKV